MYVVQVVQAGSGLRFGPAGRQHHSSNRSVSADATNGREGLSHGVIHMPPSHETPLAAAPTALTCQPIRTAVVPWMRHIAVLMRTPDHHHHLQHRQQRLPPSLRTRCSTQDCSSAVLTAAAPSSTSSSTNPSTVWGEGPDPLTIYLPGADGTAESSPADPASAGLPNTPTVVSSSSNSLALKQSAALQHRQRGELGLRPGSGGSRTLPTMLQQRGTNSALQSKPPVGIPAAANPSKQQSSMVPVGNLQPKMAGPMGFLPALQWGNSSTYWGSPIGGTLFINPPVEEPPQLQATMQQQHRQQQHQLTKDSGVYWGSPIGGTLYVNPPVEDSAAAAAAGMSPQPAAAAADNSSSKRQRMYWGSPIGGTLFINPPVDVPFGQDPSLTCQLLREGTGTSAVAAAAGANSAAAGVVAAAAAAAGSNTLLPGVSMVRSNSSKTSRLPFLPPFKWGDTSSSTVQWGSPIGGTLYINPQAPAEWHEGPWGSGGSGFGSSSGGSGNGSSSAGGGGGSRAGSSSSSSGARGGLANKQLGSAYASAGAGRMLPSSLGLVKLGVGLMAAMAAAALAMYQTSSPAAGRGSSSSSSSHGAVETRSTSATAAGGGAAAAALSSPSAGSAAAGAAGAEAASAPAGAGFHEWMVQRLQSALESFEAEQGLLRAELSVLQDMSAAHSSQQGVLGGFRRWLGSSGRASTGTAGFSNQEVRSDGEAVSAGVESGGRAVGMSAADVAGRVAEIEEQLDSISVLRAALSAELREHQQMLQKAEQQQQAAQERLAALAGR